MDKILDYIMLVDLQSLIAPFTALLVALIENRGKHFADYILVALASVSVGGVVDEYIPSHSIFISMLVGVMAGVLSDDLFVKIREEFPSLLDEIMKGISTWVKSMINKYLGKDKKEDE